MPPVARRFRFIPLSPVHIGSGQLLEAENYVTFDDWLIAFNSSALIRDLDDQRRAQLERLLEGRDPKPALTTLREIFRSDLRQNGGRSRWELYRVRLGRGSRSDLKSLVENPLRRGEVHTLVRNPYTGDVVIPGSAIKGAIRTAVLSHLAGQSRKFQQWQQEVRRIDQQSNNPRERDRRLHALGEQVEAATLGVDKAHTERDPFRFLHVSDAAWPASGVQIDQVHLENIKKDDKKDEQKPARIQIHVERLLSFADNVELPECFIEISLDEQAPRHPSVRQHVQRPLDWNLIFEACSNFYTGRFNAEIGRFRQIFGTDVRRWYPEFQPGDLFLRVGRHSHFDSLSIDGLRSGWNAQARKPIAGIGSTRMLCDLNGGGRAPFGWVILRPV